MTMTVGSRGPTVDEQSSSCPHSTDVVVAATAAALSVASPTPSVLGSAVARAKSICAILTPSGTHYCAHEFMRADIGCSSDCVPPSNAFAAASAASPFRSSSAARAPRRTSPDTKLLLPIFGWRWRLSSSAAGIWQRMPCPGWVSERGGSVVSQIAWLLGLPGH